MKVALIVNFPPHTGMGRYTFEIYKHLKDKIDLDLFGPIGMKKDHIKEIDEMEFPIFKKTLNSYYFYPSYFKKVRGYDLFHITNELICRVAKFATPSVITVTDVIFLKAPETAPFLTRYLINKSLDYLKQTEKIISISEDTKNDLINLLNIDESKIVVTLLGVDHESFKKRDKILCRKKLNLPADKKIIIQVGSEEPRRNTDVLIKAFHEVQKTFPQTILVRIGSKIDSMLPLIRKLGLEEKVFRMGKVEENTLPLYYSAADIFVCLDTDTGFGLPTLEAMSCGTNVICSREGAFPEVVGSSGFLVNPYSKDEVAESLTKLLENKKLRDALTRNEIRRAKKFSWKKCADETLKVYEEVLK